MNNLDPLNSGLYFSAANQAAQLNKEKESSAKKTGGSRRVFSDFLKTAEDSSAAAETNDIPPEIAKLSYAKAIETLLDSVYSSGSVLSKNQTMEEVQNYKRAVKNFVNFVVKNCYEVESHQTSKSTAMLRRKRPKQFYLVEVIDKKLDKLATEVLINQRNQLAFLAKIEEINGLLIDLKS